MAVKSKSGKKWKMMYYLVVHFFYKEQKEKQKQNNNNNCSENKIGLGGGILQAY